jgi:hypothetical protein
VDTNAAPQQLTTVLAADQTVIHVAMVEQLSPPLSDEHRTLCGHPVVCQVSAQSFHRLGCSACARVAVHSGFVSIADRRQSTVNLPRFLAALRSREESPPAGTLPGQRDAFER